MDEFGLSDRLIAHDEDTYSSVIKEYSKLLWVVVSGILLPGGSAEDVEECVSNVFLELWQHPSRYEPARGSLKSYLCVVAKSRAFNMYRDQSKDKAVISFEDNKLEPTFEEETFTGVTDYSALYDAMRQLEEPTKEILIRRYFNGEKPQRIADKLQLPKKEVENRLYRGKKALRAILTKDKEAL